MRLTLLAAVIGSLTTLSVANATEIFAGERAQQIAQDSIIIDTHIDVPWRLMNDWEDMSGAAERGDYDYERAVAGGLNAPFMAIYIPSSYEDNGAYTLANHLIDFVESMVYRAPDKYAIAHRSADIYEHFEQGLISL
ncbi:MAG: membrane dipeptidase, partial [Idiomarina sp.]|nr:membrane dipeptidase [Idiomarina sp.]